MIRVAGQALGGDRRPVGEGTVEHAEGGVVGRCEADAVDGNTIAQRDIAQIELAGQNAQLHIAAARLQFGDLADGLNDPGKHLSSSSIRCLWPQRDTQIAADRAADAAYR